MSSSPVRLCTNSSPSTASSSAATHPSRVEPNSRRPIRPIIRMARVPTTALENRQPKELSIPKIDSPKPIIHLPTGGWTTESPYVAKTFGVPLVKSASGFFRVGWLARSMPYFQIE